MYLRFTWLNVILITIFLCLLVVIGALLIYNYFLLPDNSNKDTEENIRVINEYLNRLFTDYPY